MRVDPMITTRLIAAGVLLLALIRVTSLGSAANPGLHVDRLTNPAKNGVSLQRWTYHRGRGIRCV